MPLPARLRAPLAVVLALALLGACSSTGPREDAPEAPRAQDADALGEQRDLERLARLAFERPGGGDELRALLADGAPRVRAGAARALGHLPPTAGDPEATTAALVAALDDPAPAVRAAAAFALGLRGDPAAGPALTRAAGDPVPAVRAAAVGAGGGVADPALRDAVLRALFERQEPEPLVRAAAATIPFTEAWPREGERAATVDQALLAALDEAGAAETESELPDRADGLAWRLLFTLSRRRAEAARGAFVAWSTRPRAPLARLYAVRGLAGLEPDAASRAALLRAAGDADWRVACEALVGLGADGDPSVLPAFSAALERPSSHVRRVAAEQLGALEGQATLALALLERAAHDESPAVCAGALVSRARLQGAEAVPELEIRALDREPVVRAAVAEACRHVPADQALPLLERLARDDLAVVAYAAVEALGAHLDAGGRAAARRALEGADNGLRLAAVLALGVAPTAEDVPALARAFRTSEGDVATEVRFNALEVAARAGGEAAVRLLLEGAREGEPHVRAVAARLLGGLEPPVPAPASERPPTAPPDVDWSRLTPAPAGERPVVELATTRGTLVFELLPAVAPIHVHNFLTLAARGHYDGLSFHRVVPDFVVQGGDPRGDGNGAPTWCGRPLPAELSPLPYLTGALGMPRNEDLDSGGCQLFVTHRPTPHLDRRYTLFGTLRQGREALETLEPGDRILGVRVRGGR